RNGWIHQHDKGAADHADDRDVANEIEIEPVIQCRIDCDSRVKPKKRMAVGWRTNDCFGGDVAGCACPVLDDDWLAELFCERLSQQADEDVGAPTGWIAHDPAYRSRWIGLRPGKARRDRQHDRACGQMQDVAAWKSHEVLHARHVPLATSMQG